MSKLWILLRIPLVGLCASVACAQTCSWDGAAGLDPALTEMEYDVGDGPQTTLVYVEPDIKTFYEDGDAPASTKVQPMFNGFAAKFINMSNKPLRFYWEAYAGATPNLMRYYAPFNAGGTATFPGHRFFFTTDDNSETKVQEFIVGDYPENLYIYDPYHVEGDPEQTEKNLKQLTRDERKKYDKWRKTIVFNEQYLNFTGRSYLANYLRKPPLHFLWPADFFGQEHWVVTQETHFSELPPPDKLNKIRNHGRSRVLKENDPRLLQEYRVPGQSMMNMTLKVLSVAPRVYEIPNFLSDTEVSHILQLAGGIDLKESTTGDVGQTSKEIDPEEEKARKTRTSKNSWVERERTPIIDAIYRRAADLLRIDESLLRHRDKGEADLPTLKTVAESLQLVHYDRKQEYTAHSDFGYSIIDDENNGARFATLLFYLNGDMIGGETSFPRYVNAETFEKLKVKPEAGKAVLFYSQLPDGNMDDFSQHAAEPVIAGEKWLINLWVWDPIYQL